MQILLGIVVLVVLGYLGHRRRSKMTPEQRASEDLRREVRRLRRDVRRLGD